MRVTTCGRFSPVIGCLMLWMTSWSDGRGYWASPCSIADRLPRETSNPLPSAAVPDNLSADCACGRTDRRCRYPSQPAAISSYCGSALPRSASAEEDGMIQYLRHQQRRDARRFFIRALVGRCARVGTQYYCHMRGVLQRPCSRTPMSDTQLDSARPRCLPVASITVWKRL